MVDYLGLILKNKLINQPGIQKISGNTTLLTKEIEVADKDNNPVGSKILKYPVADQATVSHCEETGDLFVPMIPDSDFWSVSYFEGGNTRKLRDNDYITDMRFVWWGNLYLLGEIDKDSNLPTLIMANVIKVLTKTNLYNEGIFQGINVRVKNIPPKSSDIFAKYTYDEPTTQYTFFPYDYFAIDFEIVYSVNPNCLNDIILNNPILCAFGNENRQFSDSADPSFS